MIVAATMPPKKSLFSKPSWASVSPNAESTSPSIFGNRVYEDILKVEKQRKAEEQATARAEVAAKAETESAALKETEEARAANIEPRQKRRRLTLDEGSEEPESEDARHEHPRSTPIRHSNPVRTSLTPSKRKRTPPIRSAVSISDDEADAELAGTSNLRVHTQKTALKSKPSPRRPKPTPAVPDSEDDDDEYTRELKRKARERVRGEAAQPHKPSTQNQSKASTNIYDIGSPTSHSFDDKPFDEHLSAAPDALLRLLIIPRIPKTNKLIVTRHASQTLKIVKDAWCKRQGFDEAGATKVVLTWRGNRLWNSSTLQGALRQLQKERPDEVFDVTNENYEAEPIITDENEGSNPEVRKGGRIELEAWTEEQYDVHVKEQEAKAEREARRAASGMLNGDFDPPSSSIPDSAQHTAASNATNTATHPHSIMTNPSKPQQEVSSSSAPIITLLCCGREPFQIRVRPNSTIDKVMRGYQQRKKNPEEGEDEGKVPWLVFDGARLEPKKTIQECELEDGDQVEVHWR